tara:strand:+ start:457 stop:1242 length:786 start_codon:yes stop_codon:yes gene_type:complete
VQSLNRNNLDLTTSVESLADRLSGSTVVINAVAYTNVDAAELDYDAAYFANAEVPRKLAAACTLTGSRLIHISTDYVFDGEAGTAYKPNSPRNPQSIYGNTKLAGEDAVLNFENTQVIRTSWLYGANGRCFPKTIATMLLADQEISVVNDQFGSPTHTLDLAEFALQLGSHSINERMMHGVSSGSTSWYEFAREIAQSLGLRTKLITATSTAAYPARARRPANAVLEPSTASGYQLPDWKSAWNSAADSVLRDLGTIYPKY